MTLTLTPLHPRSGGGTFPSATTFPGPNLFPGGAGLSFSIPTTGILVVAPLTPS